MSAKPAAAHLTEFCEWTPDKHDFGDGKPAIKGEMGFQVTDQPTFAVAGFWQQTAEGNGFTMVTCDSNELVAPIHPKAMITILEPDDVDTGLRGSYGGVAAALRGRLHDRSGAGVSLTVTRPMRLPPRMLV